MLVQRPLQLVPDSESLPYCVLSDTRDDVLEVDPETGQKPWGTFPELSPHPYQ
jgi:hypothetical protein